MPQDAEVLALLVARRIRQDVQSVHAYAIQDSAGMVKLDAMENPHRLPIPLQEELGRRLGSVALNRYPGDRVEDLRRALVAHTGIPADHDLMLGNGSDELISLLALACATPADPVAGGKPVVLAPEPGFVMYAVSAQFHGLAFVGVPLRADFTLDVQALVEAIDQHQPAIVYLAYPNNPTANLWDDGAMAQVVDAAARSQSLVVIDEAYQPFSSKTYLDQIRAQPARHAHVLLMRTLSKFGLAGVRIGYLCGRRELIEQIDKLRPPYNISVLNTECALFALEHADVFALQADDIKEQRKRLLHAFGGMAAVHPFPSDANMILLRLQDPEDRAGTVFEALKARGVLVKNVSKMHPLLRNCLRVTVGTASENDRLLAALQEIL